MSSSPRLIAVLAPALCLVSCLSAQASGKKAAEHWVATWATAQQLAPSTFGPPRSGTNSGGPARFTPPPNSPQSPIPATLADQTVRMIAHTSVGGRSVRISLSNMTGGQPLEIGAAHVARYQGDGAIASGTDRPLSFGGSASITIPPGVLAVSDPVALDVAPLSDLAISLYLPHDTGAPAGHPVGLHTAYIAKGDATAAVAMPEPTTLSGYLWLTGVDVLAAPDAYTVVALGDSITDGYATTRDANRSWPALLAKRFQASKATQHIAVINQGISGNQVLRDGAGVSALARLERDVIGRPGVKWVVLLEGINDINIRGRAEGPNALTAEALIQGYRQIIERCHQLGIKVMGATLTPAEGVPTYSERGEGIRQKANEWIRKPGNFDAIVDFDAVLRDPQNAKRIRAELDPGDHIHPNDNGNQIMADAFDLKLFVK